MEVTLVMQLLLCSAVMIQACSGHASSPVSEEGLSTVSDHELMPKLKNVGLAG